MTSNYFDHKEEKNERASIINALSRSPGQFSNLLTNFTVHNKAYNLN